MIRGAVWALSRELDVKLEAFVCLFLEEFLEFFFVSRSDCDCVVVGRVVDLEKEWPRSAVLLLLLLLDWAVGEFEVGVGVVVLLRATEEDAKGKANSGDDLASCTERRRCEAHFKRKLRARVN